MAKMMILKAKYKRQHIRDTLIQKVRRQTLILKCYKGLVVAAYAPSWSNVLHSEQATKESSNREITIPDNSSREETSLQYLVSAKQLRNAGQTKGNMKTASPACSHMFVSEENLGP
jgi:hypothetical protein